MAETSVQTAGTQGAAPIPLAGRALFSTGDMVDGVANLGVGVFIFYYLTAVCGLPPTTAGALLGLSILLDAVLDPLIGTITDTARTRWGRRVPFMLAAAFPAAIAFAMLFSVPARLTGSGLVAYVAVVLVAFRISTSFYILPYAAAGAELSDDYAERSALIAWRTFYNCIGNIAVLVLGYWVFMRGETGLLNRAAYSGFGWTGAALALAGGLASGAATHRMRHRLKVPPPAEAGLRQLADGLKEVARNRSFWQLFLSALAFWTAAGLVSTLGLHANLYFWRLPTAVISLVPIVAILGYLVGIPLCTLTLTRFEKRDVSLIGFAICCGVLVLPVPLRLLGVLPAEGPVLYGVLCGLALVNGVGGTFGFVPLGSMIADAADEHELLFDRRREGLYFAGLLLSVKAAAGLGGFLGGLALDAIRFPRDVASIATHPLSRDTIVGLGLVHGPLAGAIGVLSAVALLGYRIDRARLTDIQARLAERRAGRA